MGHVDVGEEGLEGLVFGEEEVGSEVFFEVLSRILMVFLKAKRKFLLLLINPLQDLLPPDLRPTLLFIFDLQIKQFPLRPSLINFHDFSDEFVNLSLAINFLAFHSFK